MKRLDGVNRKRKSLSFLIGMFLVIVITFWGIDSLSFKVSILGFHSIFDRNYPNQLPSRAAYLDYSIQDLETVLETLIQEKYWFLSSQDFYDYFLSQSKKIPKKHIGQRPVMLTFDDGYKNINTFVLPLLEKLEQKYKIKIPIVLFLNPAFMTRKPSKNKIEYLNCHQVKTGLSKGFYDVQSAGMNHVNLTKISTSELEFELQESQKQLQKCIGEIEENQVALHFAYPYNRINRKVIAHTAKYYKSGYLYDDKIHKINRFHHHYRLSRWGVLRRDPPQKLINYARQASKILPP